MADLDGAEAALVAPVLDWYAHAARDLPWRRAGTSPWAVLVSEIMLQQTPVARVLPAYDAWLARWPTPAALAAEAPGEAVRQWGRLGYPRRALRLHQAATRIVEAAGGAVPSEVDALRALPGIGSYTANAVAAFAYGRRVPVVDTNVSRVLARAVEGEATARPTSIAKQQRALLTLLPVSPAKAARFSVALMELGALVCTARTPMCDACPLANTCNWRLRGYPPYDGPRTASQKFEGTDRYVRGLLLGALRDAHAPVSVDVLDHLWPHQEQRDRALASLATDGLAVKQHDGTYALP